MSDEKRFNLQEIFRSYQSKPMMFWVLLMAAGIGVVLLLSGNDNSAPKTVATQTPVNGNRAVSDEERLEAELTHTLEQISGAGHVRVDLNLKAESRNVWERQIRTNKRVSQGQGSVQTEEDTNDEMVFAKDRDGRDTPVLKEKLAPEIQGVIVVASGASNDKVRQMLTSTVMTILGLPAHRVMVIPGDFREEGKHE
jgi:stage III sporulation protein AG